MAGFTPYWVRGKRDWQLKLEIEIAELEKRQEDLLYVSQYTETSPAEEKEYARIDQLLDAKNRNLALWSRLG